MKFVKFFCRVLLLLCLAIGIHGFSATEVLNGNWWRSTPNEERLGFVFGYVDYGYFEAKDTRLYGCPPGLLVQKMNSFFDLNKNQNDKNISDLLVQVCAQNSVRPSPKPTRGKHGFLDGDYWRGSAPDHRLGFVLGFIEAARSYQKPKVGFARSARWYVAEISNWYGVKESDPGQIIEARMKTKIAIVLLGLKDG